MSFLLLRVELNLPPTVYAEMADSIDAHEQTWACESISDWCQGTQSWQEVAELYFWLDEDADLDYLFVFFGIPNGQIRLNHRRMLNQAIIDIGTRRTDVANSISFETAYKYAKQRRFG